MRAVPALVLVALTLWLGGCATTLDPGTGDVSFRLRWDGTADLDLHIVDPLGRHVGIEQAGPGSDYEAHLDQVRIWREAATAHEDVPVGILDIDCNADPTRVCERPIENVFWPTGTAPDGEYEVWVNHFQNVFGDESVAYELEIRRGDRVVERHRGEVD
ncbi:MAG: hypothetical protein AAGD38_23150, partial [Acidobacteriota bacterium]